MSRLRLVVNASVDEALLTGFLQAFRTFDQEHPGLVDIQIVGDAPELGLGDIEKVVANLEPPIEYVAFDADLSSEAWKLGEATGAWAMATNNLADWLIRLSAFAAELDELEVPVVVSAHLAGAPGRYPERDLPLAVYRNKAAESRRG